MLDIVAPDQHQAAPAVHGGGVDHGQPRHPPAIGVGAKAVGGKAAHQPCGNAGRDGKSVIDRADGQIADTEKGQIGRDGLSAGQTCLAKT